MIHDLQENQAIEELERALADASIDEVLEESFPASDPPAFNASMRASRPERLAPAVFTPPVPRGVTRLAQGLGVFSLGLGLTELLAGQQLGDMIGLESDVNVLRAFGAREIATGAFVLAAKNKAPALWGRVLGDVLDVGLLAKALAEPRMWKRSRRRTGAVVALAAVLGVTALDVIAGVALSRSRRRALRP